MRACVRACVRACARDRSERLTKCGKKHRSGVSGKMGKVDLLSLKFV